MNPKIVPATITATAMAKFTTLPRFIVAPLQLTAKYLPMSINATVQEASTILFEE
jgi:hypothetical protein